MWFLYFRRLILIFLALTPTGIYSKCCLLYLHLTSHWKVHRPNVFQLLSSSIFSFNKEFGEATFGVLAKSILSDADQSSFTKLQFSKWYKTIKGLNLIIVDNTDIVERLKDWCAVSRTLYKWFVVPHQFSQVVGEWPEKSNFDS